SVRSAAILYSLPTCVPSLFRSSKRPARRHARPAGEPRRGRLHLLNPNHRTLPVAGRQLEFGHLNNAPAQRPAGLPPFSRLLPPPAPPHQRGAPPDPNKRQSVLAHHGESPHRPRHHPIVRLPMRRPFAHLLRTPVNHL